MKIIVAPRAAAILYSLLVNREDHRPWIMPANICPIVPITFLKAGVPFEFVDITTDTLRMDVEQVEDCLKRAGYGGILYAHTYGELFTPVEWFARIKNHYPDIFLIDDRCLCVPDLEADLRSEADVTLYSTGYAKIVELNFGGYAFLNENVQYRNVHLVFIKEDLPGLEKSYKQSIEQRVAFIYQDRNWLETGMAGLAWQDYRRSIEENLKPSMEQRAHLNAIYATHLPANIQLDKTFQTWRFNIYVKDKKRVLNAIFAAGLFASSHYASLAGIMTEGRAYGAELLAGKVINLFNDQHFTAAQSEKVCQVVLENLF